MDDRTPWAARWTQGGLFCAIACSLLGLDALVTLVLSVPPSHGEEALAAGLHAAVLAVGAAGGWWVWRAALASPDPPAKANPDALDWGLIAAAVVALRTVVALATSGVLWPWVAVVLLSGGLAVAVWFRRRHVPPPVPGQPGITFSRTFVTIAIAFLVVVSIFVITCFKVLSQW